MASLIDLFNRSSSGIGLTSIRQPNLRDEWLGFLAIAGLIVFLDRFSALFFVVRFAGLIYLVAIIWVACWAGLRSALAGCAALVGYAWLIYRFIGISPFATDPTKASASITGTAIFFPLFAIVAAIIQNKLRRAALGELEARAAANIELEQRRIAEAELWASEEMRRLIVDSSGDAIIGIKEDGTITLWNPNAERLFGWSRADAIGSRLGDTIVPTLPADTGNIASVPLPQAGPTEIERRHVETVARTKSGEELSVELYIANHQTDEGRIYILFIRDISERKRAQQAIEELNSRLEERVAERTAQLEAANQELVGFTYSVSHDLRAPLRAIVSNSRIVCEDANGVLDPSTFERLKRLESSALKMAELIENLLQFARIGQVELDTQQIDLTAMASSIAKDLKATRDGTALIEAGMVVQGDPAMVHMVLFNLMENAWKYVRPGQNPSVEVGTTPEGVFFVRDEGIGFDMKYVDKIWEPFERLHRDTEYPGTGIGLANSKRIVARHGGRLWADSVPGNGTTMYFVLREKAPARKKKAASFVS